MDTHQYRDLLPASQTGRPDELSKRPSSQSSGSVQGQRPRRRQNLTRIACETCRIKKTKCDGRRPVCSRCELDSFECGYDCEPDISRVTAQRRKNAILQQDVRQQRLLLEHLASCSRAEAVAILDRMRFLLGSAGLDVFGNSGSTTAVFEQLTAEFPASNLDLIQSPKLNSSHGMAAVSSAVKARLSALQSPADRVTFVPTLPRGLLQATLFHPSLDKPSMLDELLIGPAPSKPVRPLYRLRAHPWTTVTDDDRLVSHLVSLFISWDDNFLSFMDRDRLLEAMARGDVKSELCSPFLVNALLAYACASYGPEVTLHGLTREQVDTLGDEFHKASKALWEAELGRSSLTNLYGLYMTLMRHGINGQDKMSHLVFEQVFVMVKDLALFTEDQTTDQTGPKGMQRARRIAAWGVFNCITLSNVAYLRPQALRAPQVPRPFFGRELEVAEEWSPYPLAKPDIPAYYRRRWDESCNLSIISVEILNLLYKPDSLTDPLQAWPMAEALGGRLQQWKLNLPGYLTPTDGVAAVILTLHMQFCCMKMALFGPFRDISTRGFAPNARRAEKIYLESAEQLAQLLYQHQKSFTLRLGACGIVLFASLAASGLLDALEFQTRAATAKPSSQRSEQQSQNQARRGELLHVAVKLMAAAGLRFRLGRGMLHVVAERVEKLAQRSPFTGRIAVLPQTCRLLRDFEEHVWCYESPEYYSSIMPEYSSATRELLKNKGSGPHQLTAMLSKLAVREE